MYGGTAHHEGNWWHYPLPMISFSKLAVERIMVVQPKLVSKFKTQILPLRRKALTTCFDVLASTSSLRTAMKAGSPRKIQR